MITSFESINSQIVHFPIIQNIIHWKIESRLELYRHTVWVVLKIVHRANFSEVSLIAIKINDPNYGIIQYTNIQKVSNCMKVCVHGFIVVFQPWSMIEHSVKYIHCGTHLYPLMYIITVFRSNLFHLHKNHEIWCEVGSHYEIAMIHVLHIKGIALVIKSIGDLLGPVLRKSTI